MYKTKYNFFFQTGRYFSIRSYKHKLIGFTSIRLLLAGHHGSCVRRRHRRRRRRRRRPLSPSNNKNDQHHNDHKKVCDDHGNLDTQQRRPRRHLHDPHGRHEHHLHHDSGDVGVGLLVRSVVRRGCDVARGGNDHGGGSARARHGTTDSKSERGIPDVHDHTPPPLRLSERSKQKANESVGRGGAAGYREVYDDTDIQGQGCREHGDAEHLCGSVRVVIASHGGGGPQMARRSLAVDVVGCVTYYNLETGGDQEWRHHVDDGCHHHGGVSDTLFVHHTTQCGDHKNRRDAHDTQPEQVVVRPRREHFL
eukprot:PhM_4_TR5196/c0_g1_i1/m.46789